ARTRLRRPGLHGRVRVLAAALGVMLAVAAALPSAAAAFVYWANASTGTIGRAHLDGSGANQSFITGASTPDGVAVAGAHIYWATVSTGTIGRANVDGSGANQSFITGASNPVGVAVDGAHIYWANFGTAGSGTTIGRANLDGSSAGFITGATGPYGV